MFLNKFQEKFQEKQHTELLNHFNKIKITDLSHVLTVTSVTPSISIHVFVLEKVRKFFWVTNYHF